MQLTNSIHCMRMDNYSYMIIDKKIAIIDGVASDHVDQWLFTIHQLLSHRQPDYFIISHLSHINAILSLCHQYPHMQLILNAYSSAFDTISNPIYMIHHQYTIHLGLNTLLLTSINHMTLIYDQEKKILFSGPAFSIAHNNQSWSEAARYYYAQNSHYFNHSLLDILKSLDYAIICPFDGPIITHNFKQYIRYYELWIQCIPEADGVFIITDSHHNRIYQACLYLQQALKQKGDTVFLYDISDENKFFIYSMILKYDRIMIAISTSDIIPFFNHIQNRVIGGIYDDVHQADELKKDIAHLNNILCVEPVIIDDHYQSLMDLMVQTIMEVGCSEGVCM